MKFRVEVVCLHEGGEQRCNVLEMERTELALETLGLSVAEGKAMLHGVQDFVATQQGIEDLEEITKVWTSQTSTLASVGVPPEPGS